MVIFWQKQMQLDELTQSEWRDMAHYIHYGDKKYSTA